MSPTIAANTLRAVSIAYGLFGLAWATAAFAPIDAPGRFVIDLLDWPLDGVSGALGPLARWTNAVGAGLLVGLCTLFALVVAPAVERGERRVARAATIALGAWYVIDTAGALANGIAVLGWNTLFLLGWLLPLLLVRARSGDTASDRASEPGRVPSAARPGSARHVPADPR